MKAMNELRRDDAFWIKMQIIIVTIKAELNYSKVKYII